MKRLILALSVLVTLSGLALAQDNASPRSGIDRTQTDRMEAQSSERMDAQRSDRMDAPVADTEATSGATTAERGAEAGRGTGVATGFVAAGIGLALLGLFVRRRNRRYGAPPKV